MAQLSDIYRQGWFDLMVRVGVDSGTMTSGVLNFEEGQTWLWIKEHRVPFEKKAVADFHWLAAEAFGRQGDFEVAPASFFRPWDRAGRYRYRLEKLDKNSAMWILLHKSVQDSGKEIEQGELTVGMQVICLLRIWHGQASEAEIKMSGLTLRQIQAVCRNHDSGLFLATTLLLGSAYAAYLLWPRGPGRILQGARVRI